MKFSAPDSFFVYNWLIGCSKKNAENYPKLVLHFWQKKKTPRLKLTWVSAKWPSNSGTLKFKFNLRYEGYLKCA